MTVPMPSLTLSGGSGCCGKNKDSRVVYDSADRSFTLEKCTCRWGGCFCCSNVSPKEDNRSTWDAFDSALQKAHQVSLTQALGELQIPCSRGDDLMPDVFQRVVEHIQTRQSQPAIDHSQDLALPLPVNPISVRSATPSGLTREDSNLEMIIVRHKRSNSSGPGVATLTREIIKQLNSAQSTESKSSDDTHQYTEAQPPVSLATYTEESSSSNSTTQPAESQPQYIQESSSSNSTAQSTESKPGNSTTQPAEVQSKNSISPSDISIPPKSPEQDAEQESLAEPCTIL